MVVVGQNVKIFRFPKRNIIYVTYNELMYFCIYYPLIEFIWFLISKMDKNYLCFPSSGSTDHARSTDEVLQTLWPRPSKLAKFAVLHSTCMLVCQLVLYLLACRWKCGSLFQNHRKDFTNQLGHTCLIVNRCCPDVCILLCVKTCTKHYLNLELQHCFTSGLLIKATEDLLGLARSRLQSTTTSSCKSCTAVSELFGVRSHRC